MLNKIKELLTRKYTKSEAIGILLSIVAVGILIDLRQGRFSILFIILSIFSIILGYRQFKHKKNSMAAYILMALGTGFLLFSLFISFAFTLIFATLLIYNSYQIFRSSSNPSKMALQINPNSQTTPDYVQTDPYFKNKLVGEYRNFDEGYPLEDINLQTGFGDISIDLSDQVIPAGETVILIRGMIGNIDLNVPSDVGISLQMSLLCGKIKLLKDSKTAFNVTKKYQSADYKDASRKVKIVVSLLVGDIEVSHR